MPHPIALALLLSLAPAAAPGAPGALASTASTRSPAPAPSTDPADDVGVVDGGEAERARVRRDLERADATAATVRGGLLGALAGCAGAVGVAWAGALMAFLVPPVGAVMLLASPALPSFGAFLGAGVSGAIDRDDFVGPALSAAGGAATGTVAGVVAGFLVAQSASGGDAGEVMGGLVGGALGAVVGAGAGPAIYARVTEGAGDESGAE